MNVTDLTIKAMFPLAKKYTVTLFTLYTQTGWAKVEENSVFLFVGWRQVRSGFAFFYFGQQV